MKIQNKNKQLLIFFEILEFLIFFVCLFIFKFLLFLKTQKKEISQAVSISLIFEQSESKKGRYFQLYQSKVSMISINLHKLYPKRMKSLYLKQYNLESFKQNNLESLKQNNLYRRFRWMRWESTVLITSWRYAQHPYSRGYEKNSKQFLGNQYNDQQQNSSH